MNVSAIQNAERIIISQREREVLRFIAQGHTSQEIAQTLYLSTHTVLSHRKNLIMKLNAKNTAHLVAKGFESGIFANCKIE